MKEIGNNSSERCGGHIHIGADYLTSTQSYVNLLSIYGNTEEVLYIICNDPQDINNRTTRYAAPISRKIEDALERGTINLQEEGDVDEFVFELQQIQGNRDSGLNFHSYNRYKTLEFRLPNGTINPEAWIQNINLFGGIVKSAEEIKKIKEKEPEERTEEECKIIQLFKKLESNELANEEKLEILLKLVIDEENRQIYKRRYEENIKLLSDAQKKSYTEGTSKKTINTRTIMESDSIAITKVNNVETEKKEEERC